MPRKLSELLGKATQPAPAASQVLLSFNCTRSGTGFRVRLAVQIEPVELAVSWFGTGDWELGTGDWSFELFTGVK